MNTMESRRLLETMIEYFATGNQTTDAVAKLILEADFANRDLWKQEVKKLKSGTEWSGIRAAEADVLVLALRQISEMLDQRLPEK